ncbi:MAG: hypothetical protein E3K32_09515 [wastewater metagenome]|nr:hypothetical protein [Candidatus Loosdrechtia aerotolerans]
MLLTIGNGSTYDSSIPVRVDINLGDVFDTIPPVGSISINGGDTYTNSKNVTVSLSATDNVGIVGYYCSENSTQPSPFDTVWESVSSTTNYNANVKYRIKRKDGKRRVLVWYKDAAGNVSEGEKDTIILDRTSPTIKITVPTNKSDYTTSDSTISLGGTASDSTSGIGAIEWSDNNGGVGTSSGTTNWTISNIKLSPGDNVITVTATDKAGNTGTDTITVVYVKDTDQWDMETIDSSGDISNFYPRAMAIDSNNYPHIVYGGDHLYYAYYDGNSWNYETVDSSIEAGYYASIALDSSDKAHISYYHNNSKRKNLKYATNASGSWEKRTVDSKGDVGRFSGIAVDLSGRIHIVYYGATNKHLKYATAISFSGPWKKETIDSIEKVGKFASIAVDSSNNVRISYYDESRKDLKYITNASGSWKSKKVDKKGSVGKYTSITTDSSGKIHIAYYNDKNKDLKYAVYSTGSWEAETVDSNGDVGPYTSIAIDLSGRVHISYFDVTKKDLKYAVKSLGSWELKTLDSKGSVGKYTSLAVDSVGSIHISYYDIKNKRLKYITNKN